MVSDDDNVSNVYRFCSNGGIKEPLLMLGASEGSNQEPENKQRLHISSIMKCSSPCEERDRAENESVTVASGRPSVSLV